MRHSGTALPGAELEISKNAVGKKKPFKKGDENVGIGGEYGDGFALARGIAGRAPFSRCGSRPAPAQTNLARLTNPRASLGEPGRKDDISTPDYKELRVMKKIMRNLRTLLRFNTSPGTVSGRRRVPRLSRLGAVQQAASAGRRTRRAGERIARTRAESEPEER